jgi:nitrate/nitrite transport system permease protein
MKASLGVRAGLLSLLLLGLMLGVWHLATLSSAPVAVKAAPVLTAEQIEYARLMGKDPAAEAAGVATPSQKAGFPTLAQMGTVMAKHLSSPFYDNGPNDKGVGLQLAYSLGRVALGYLLAALVAIPLGFVIGMSPLMYRALDPFIQVLKPISPLAWMPLALYTIKDSAISGIFVIFICSIWPMLLNTAFGVASVRREWLNVARTLPPRPPS